MSSTELIPFDFSEVPIDEYHADREYMSKSKLALMLDCPARLKAVLDGQVAPSTDSQRLGSLGHMIALEPYKFEQAYHVIPSEMVKNASHGAYKAEIEKANGREIIKYKEVETAIAQARAMRESPKTKGLLEGIYEATFRWEREDGMKLQHRPDILQHDGRVVDIKIVADASPAAFFKASAGYGYDLSVALAAEALSRFEGLRDYLFLCVEKAPPHLIEVYSGLTPDANGLTYLAYGQCRLEKAIRRYQECMEADCWPSYNAGVVPMEVPLWDQRLLERELNKELEG